MNEPSRLPVVRDGLRRKLIRTMVGTLALVATTMLVSFVVIEYRSARKSLVEIEAKIRDSITRKGRGLARNHALALRGLVADNAFSDVGRLVENTVKEDQEIVYGLFVAADGAMWAHSAPNLDRGRVPPGAEVLKRLGIDSGASTRPGEVSSDRNVLGRKIFEFSAAVEGEDKIVLGRIFYGLSSEPLDEALSKARDDFKRALTLAVILIGLVGLGATLSGWLLITKASSRITGPLAHLTEVITAIAAGRRDERVAVGGEDEIGVLGRAFNQMLGELNESYGRLEALNRTLEQRVEERTRELGQRNRDMRLVLDNVHQGFLTISRSGALASERSSIVDRWFGPYTSGAGFSDYIRKIDPLFADSFALGYDALVEDVLPLELCIDQLPKTFHNGKQDFSCTYVPLLDGSDLQGLLIVINDVTEQLLHARQEAEQRELVAMFQAFNHDRSGFLAFFDEGSQIVQQLTGDRGDVTEQKRLLHTLKGNAALVGLGLVAQLAHKAEDEVAERDPARYGAAISQVKTRWKVLADALATLVGERGRSTVEIEEREIDEMLVDLERGTTPQNLAARLASWRFEPVDRPLSRLGNHAVSLARRLGKGELQVEVEPGGVLLDPRRWTSFWSELVHVVRNAVDHGLEAPQERKAAGKSPNARMKLTARLQGEQLVVSVEDDGRGVDWEAVRSVAKKRQLPHASLEDLTKALFAADLSTRTQVTALSGRGVGLSAVAARVKELGGQIEVQSRPSRGTVFRFTFALKGAGVAGTVAVQERMPVATYA